MRFAVNLETGVFTPVEADITITHPSMRMIEVDSVPNAEQEQKILAYLRARAFTQLDPVKDGAANRSRLLRGIQMTLTRVKSGQGGSLVGLAQESGVPLDTLEAIDSGEAVSLSTLEYVHDRIRNRIGVGAGT